MAVAAKLRIVRRASTGAVSVSYVVNASCSSSSGTRSMDDDVLSGRILAESGAATQTDVTFGSLPLVKVPKHVSDTSPDAKGRVFGV
jgi:hypothetical protein